MDHRKMFVDKPTTAAEAVRVVRSGDWVDYGFCVAHPVALDKALAARSRELTDVDLRGGVPMWTPAIPEVPPEESPFAWNDHHFIGASRNPTRNGNCFHIPVRYSEIPRDYRENVESVDVVMIQVAPMDVHGWFNFGPNASHLMAVCERAKTIIVEVNRNMPRCLGGMPNAIGRLLAQSDFRDLGGHTEMYVDAFVDFTAMGKITGTFKTLNRYRRCYTSPSAARSSTKS